MKLYSMPSSGNSYKVRLLLSLLGQTVDTINVEYGWQALADAKASGALPFGKAPVLHTDDGRAIPESNAILCYLGASTPFEPSDPVTKAQMLGWLFWEQYNHEPVIAVRAALRNYPERAHLATPERMAELLDKGHAVLQTLEDRLTHHDWLAGDAVSFADICLYAYTHTAGPLGGFEMERFPAINNWLSRIAALPGYKGLDQ